MKASIHIVDSTWYYVFDVAHLSGSGFDTIQVRRHSPMESTSFAVSIFANKGNSRFIDGLGLCGNNDGVSSNDRIQPNGQASRGVADFIRSWTVQDLISLGLYEESFLTKRESSCSPHIVSYCSPAEEEKAKEICKCVHDLFKQQCIFDACLGNWWLDDTIYHCGDLCVNDCSGHGLCNDGKCTCFEGYNGPHCSGEMTGTTPTPNILSPTAAPFYTGQNITGISSASTTYPMSFIFIFGLTSLFSQAFFL